MRGLNRHKRGRAPASRPSPHHGEPLIVVLDRCGYFVPAPVRNHTVDAAGALRRTPGRAASQPSGAFRALHVGGDRDGAPTCDPPFGGLVPRLTPRLAQHPGTAGNALGHLALRAHWIPQELWTESQSSWGRSRRPSPMVWRHSVPPNDHDGCSADRARDRTSAPQAKSTTPRRTTTRPERGTSTATSAWRGAAALPPFRLPSIDHLLTAAAAKRSASAKDTRTARPNRAARNRPDQISRRT